MSELFDDGYALLIGIDENRVTAFSLPEVKKDILAIKNVLTHPERCGYKPENVKVLLGQEASQKGILSGFAWLKRKLSQDKSNNETAVIYYSGHGWRDIAARPPEYYLIPYDVDEKTLRNSSLRASDFAREILKLKPRRLLVLLDCCHSGGMGVKNAQILPVNSEQSNVPPSLFMTEDTNGGIGISSKGINPLAQGEGRAILSSSQGTQQSYVRKDRLMSVFTYHLIEALTGHADATTAGNDVLVSDVVSHVYRSVPRSALEYGVQQQPDFQISGNFPIALLLGGKGIKEGEKPPNPAEDFARIELSHPESSASTQMSVGNIDAKEHTTVNITGGDSQQNYRNTGGGSYYDIEGGIKAGRDVVLGNQVNVNHQAPTAKTKSAFARELQNLQHDISRALLEKDLTPAQSRNLNYVASQISMAFSEIQKSEPERNIVTQSLQDAKDTVELLKGKISQAGGFLIAIEALLEHLDNLVSD